jgi:3-hydroxyacyl-[acyl-carrier-protein] dehydratase
MRFTAEDIVKVIPHRPPFLLIDSVDVVEFGKCGVGEKKLISDGVFGDFLDTYLPKKQVMPGPMIIEAAAQTAAFIVAAGRYFKDPPPNGPPIISITQNDDSTNGSGDLVNSMGYLVKIGNFSFDEYAKEGDILSLHVNLNTVFGALHKFDVKAKVSGLEIARGSLTFSVMSVMPSG